jgi:hypothetical protein
VNGFAAAPPPGALIPASAGDARHGPRRSNSPAGPNLDRGPMIAFAAAFRAHMAPLWSEMAAQACDAQRRATRAALRAVGR